MNDPSKFNPNKQQGSDEEKQPEVEYSALKTYMEIVFGGLGAGLIPFRGFSEATREPSPSHTMSIDNEKLTFDKVLNFANYCHHSQLACYCIPGLVKESKQAKAHDIIKMGVLLVDIDQGDIEKKLDYVTTWIGEPSLVIESGGVTEEGQSKLHVYWKLSELVEGEGLTSLVNLRYQLAVKIGGDTHFQSAHQPIRIAGSVHHKYSPKLVTIRAHSSVVYLLSSLEEVVRKIPTMDGVVPAETATSHVTQKKSSVNTALKTKVREGGQDELTRFESMSVVMGHYIRLAHDGIISEDECWCAIEGHNQENLVPPWPLPRLREEMQRLKKRHIANNGPSVAKTLSMDDWPDPEYPAEIEGESQPYPLACLPKALLSAAEEVARFVKVPVASPAVIGLSVAALAIGKKAKIQERPGLNHHPALFHTLIAASGERKSPPFKLMTRPLEQWIEGQMEGYQKRVAQVNTNNQMLDTVISALKKQASSEKYHEEDKQMFIEKMTEEECSREELPPHPRMFTSDATEERLFQRMHMRGGDYSVLSGEGRPIFDSIMGKYSGKTRTGDAIYLAGISGDTITRDRVGNEKGPEDRMIIDPCLNVCVMVQPDKYLEVARHPSLRESGALARIWPVWLPSMVGTRIEEKNEPGLNDIKVQPYEQVIQDLLSTDVDEESDEDFCHFVTLSPAAKESRRQWHNSVELRMAEGNALEDVRDIASKAISATVKAALVLHLMDHPQMLRSETSEIDLDTWHRAQALGEYHLAEAVRVQRCADSHLGENIAANIVRWAEGTGNRKFSIRALSRTGPRPRLNKQDAEAVLDDMIEMKWVRQIPPSEGERTIRYEINPKCHRVLMSPR